MNDIQNIGAIGQQEQQEPWKAPQGAIVRGQNMEQQMALVNELRKRSPMYGPTFMNDMGVPMPGITFDQSQGTA